MTLHVYCNYKCSKCNAFYIPYEEQLPCPRCGNISDKSIDFIYQAVESVNYNLKRYGSYVPPAWGADNYGDYVMRLIFNVLQSYYYSKETISFEEYTRNYFDKLKWEEPFVKNHMYDVICRVNEKLKGEKQR